MGRLLSFADHLSSIAGNVAEAGKAVVRHRGLKDGGARSCHAAHSHL